MKIIAFLIFFTLYCFTSDNVIVYTVNKYKNIEATIDEKISIKTKSFELELKKKLLLWSDKTAIWLKIPIQLSKLVPIAIKNGLKAHHITNQSIMLSKNISVELPEYATNTLGVAGLVIDEQNRILVVKELYKKELGFKLPGGAAKTDETIEEAVVREVKEETNIDTEFKAIIAFRLGKRINKQPSDIYFCCLLKPLTKDIKIQETELVDACWMDYIQFKKVAANSCAQFLLAFESKYYLLPYKLNNALECTLYANSLIKLNDAYEK